ncbi:hypothetical protein DSM100685_0104 [Bifidobacterium avesanii]|nr:hypothetical protein DSM100685_0104 [Bifidobacterium avesanii]
MRFLEAGDNVGTAWAQCAHIVTSLKKHIPASGGNSGDGG